MLLKQSQQLRLQPPNPLPKSKAVPLAPAADLNYSPALPFSACHPSRALTLKTEH